MLWDGWKATARALSAAAAAAAATAASSPHAHRRHLILGRRPGLECNVSMASPWQLLSVMSDLTVVAGVLLAGKLLQLLRGRQTANSASQASERRAAAEVERLQEQLTSAKLAARSAERRLREAEAAARQHDFQAATLEGEVARLEGQVAELQAALHSAAQRVEVDDLAADNARLLEENAAALQQLRTLASALEQQAAAAQAARAEAAAAAARRGGELAELAAENEHMHATLEEARGQLAAVMAENADLAERLLQVAFEPHAESAAGGTPVLSPARRSRGLSLEDEAQRRVSVQRLQPPVLPYVRPGSAPASGGGAGAATSAFAAAAAVHLPPGEDGGEGGAAPENDSGAHNASPLSEAASKRRPASAQGSLGSSAASSREATPR
ncbi:plectin isoform X1 [Micractinium conductrix]|uniref:Plectin isoform X1 n=1 Tax=Micractinium conductrix TaxID=554055 RepID=A0A2P6VJB7_9CHLO|nr:plectin isoform X1 [Micractinium conductrix]|eukprot:PSC74196.1 plectin isoform X1 [Micractinium conductrix]